MEMPQEAVYREVAKPERLVMDGAHGVTAATFTDLGDGRTEMVLHATIQTTDEMRGATEAALASSFDRLAEQLASRLESSRHK
jgi:uncharacterized protein YndB with AHSA1/START domain